MNAENPYQKECKYQFCGEKFIAKRTNQEFCCHEHYVKHNNYKAKKKRELFNKDEIILHRNRAILNSFGENEFTIKKEILTSLGFKHNYFTKILKEDSKFLYGYYDFLLKFIDNETLKIWKNE